MHRVYIMHRVYFIYRVYNISSKWYRVFRMEQTDKVVFEEQKLKLAFVYKADYSKYRDRGQISNTIKITLTMSDCNRDFLEQKVILAE